MSHQNGSNIKYDSCNTAGAERFLPVGTHPGCSTQAIQPCYIAMLRAFNRTEKQDFSHNVTDSRRAVVACEEANEPYNQSSETNPQDNANKNFFSHYSTIDATFLPDAEIAWPYIHTCVSPV